MNNYQFDWSHLALRGRNLSFFWGVLTYCQVLPRAIIGLLWLYHVFYVMKTCVIDRSGGSPNRGNFTNFNFKCFCFSKLFYCSSVWSNTSKTNVKKMQLVQNFASRIVLGLQKYDHVSEGLKSLRWLPIAEKRLLNVSVMVHKCLNGRSTDYL